MEESRLRGQATSLLLIFSICLISRANTACTDCTVKPELPCIIQECDTTPPEVYGASNMYPGAPRDLQIHNFFKLLIDYRRHPYVNITWKPPDDASRLYIKGFELTLSRVSSVVKQTYCRYFDMRNASWNEQVDYSSTTFSYAGCLGRLTQGITYFISVTSLPPPPIRDSPIEPKTVGAYFTTPLSLEGPNASAGQWYTSIMTHVAEDGSGKMQVSFDLAPSRYGFTRYHVGFYNNATKKYARHGEMNVSGPGVEFTVPCTGPWEVHVEALDDYRNVEGRCLCKKPDGRCFSYCVVSRTAPVNVTVKNPSPDPACSDIPVSHPVDGTEQADVPAGSSSPAPQANSSTEDTRGLDLLPIIIAVPVAFFILCIIIGTILCLYIRRDSCPFKHRLLSLDLQSFDPNTTEDSGSRRENNWGPQTSLSWLEGSGSDHFTQPVYTRKLLFIYNRDCELHREVVLSFAYFMKETCQADCILQDNCKDVEAKWLSENFHLADWVVIINSEGAHKKWQEQVADRTSQNADCMFSVAVDMLCKFVSAPSNEKKKIISVSFPYTDSQYYIWNLSSRNFQLMSQISDFYIHIHGKNTVEDGTVIHVQRANENDYADSRTGRNLKEKIERMMDGQHQHRDMALDSGIIMTDSSSEELPKYLYPSDADDIGAFGNSSMCSSTCSSAASSISGLDKIASEYNSRPPFSQRDAAALVQDVFQQQFNQECRAIKEEDLLRHHSDLNSPHLFEVQV